MTVATPDPADFQSDGQDSTVGRIDVLIDDEHVAVASLRYDVAPDTAASIWDALPLTSDLMHVTCSGEGVFFAVDADLAIDVRHGFGTDGLTDTGVVVQGEPLIRAENQTCYVSQGDFVLTPHKACIIAYGRRCIIRAYGGDLPSNAFAYVRDTAQLDRLEEVAKRTLRYGAMRIELRRCS